MIRMTKGDIEAARKAGLARQGAYLRRLRSRRENLTQRDVAKTLGIEVGTVQHWERGRNPVGLEHQAALAEVLGVGAAEFVLRLALLANPLLAAVVWRRPTDQPAQGQGSAAGP